MLVTTFYSYKGGLGRTLLLSWVARALAADGQRVVALDLDLEAPGLPFKLGFDQKSDFGPGVLDLILRFQRGDEPPPDIDAWLRPVPGIAGLHLLPAGPPPSSTYWRNLATISWKELFVEAQGARFFAWLREHIESSSAQPQHLLIDARTGVTELGGAALSLMADQVLALVGTSSEGIFGTREVLRAVVNSATEVGRKVPRLGVVWSRVPATLATPDLQRHRRTIRDQLRLQSPGERLSQSLTLELPLVVRSESQLELDESLALGERRIRVHEDYQAALSWLLGSASPAEPPGVSAGADPALPTLQASIKLQRSLAESNPDAYLPDLAASLNNLSAALTNNGEREAALVAIEEATTLYRELARKRPDVFTPHLARTLRKLSAHVGDFGRREEALAAVQEATTLYRALESQQPDEFTRELAVSLNELSNRLADLGRRDEALSSIEESTKLFRVLARSKPETFTPFLATSLNNLSVTLGEFGRKEDALAAIEEAIALRRELAQTRPDTFTAALAMSLNNLSTSLSVLNRHQDALAAVREAAKLYRSLDLKHHGTFTANIAMSLFNLSLLLSEHGGPEKALLAIEEATSLYRSLDSERPGVFTQELAASINNFSERLADVGRREDALVASSEALQMIREPLKKWPKAASRRAREILETYLELVAAVGRQPDAKLVEEISSLLVE